MDNLINTVKQRYGHFVSYRNFATTTYRTSPTVDVNIPKTEEKKKAGLLDLFRPQIPGISQKLYSGISQKIHLEISKLLDRREKTVLQTLSKSMPRLVKEHTAQWETEALQIEKKRVESQKYIEKRVGLFNSDIAAKMKAMQRELEQLKIRERLRQQEEVRIQREDPVLSHRTARRMAEEYRQRERDEIIHEIKISAVKTERRVVRRLQDDEEYEKRRRG